MSSWLLNGSVGEDSTCHAGEQETRVPSLGQEDPLEEEMTTHPRILAWAVPWAEGSGLQRVRQDWAQHSLRPSWWKSPTHGPSESFSICRLFQVRVTLPYSWQRYQKPGSLDEGSPAPHSFPSQTHMNLSQIKKESTPLELWGLFLFAFKAVLSLPYISEHQKHCCDDDSDSQPETVLFPEEHLARRRDIFDRMSKYAVHRMPPPAHPRRRMLQPKM